MKKAKILLFGNYGGQNWGDEVLLSGILSGISPSFEILVVSSDPDFTRQIHGVDAVLPPPAGIRSFFRRESFRFFSVLKSADFVFFGGGGLLQNREKSAIFLWFFYAKITQFFQKKIFFVGNSIGPLSGFLAKFLAQSALKTAKFFSARDAFSFEFLKKIGKKKVAIAATDAAFLLPKFPEKKRRSGTILVFRGDGNISARKIKNLFSALPKPISAIAMDKIDEKWAKKIGVKIQKPKNLAELKSFFAGAKLVLSSRLHGAIAALCAETPFLAFSAAPKIRNFFAERGIGDAVFPEKFSRKKVLQKIQKMQKNPLPLKKIRILERKKAKNILPPLFQK